MLETRIILKRGLTLNTPYGQNTPVALVASRYAYGNALALQLFLDQPDEWPETVAIVTVNFPDEPLADDEFFCKDWSENEGMSEWLEENNIATPMDRVRASGYVYAQGFKLNADLAAKLRSAP